ncbi:MAG: restriction endonuclease subunit S [Lachnospiraceae bacterium]|nr:restriction endonuclease subunit S [Lachnospiraceae bacterium]
MKYNTHTLSELATIKYGKNQKAVLSEDGSIPIYGTGGLMGYVTMLLYDKPSVLIGRKGTIEKVHYVTHPFWTVDTLFYTIINEDIIRPHYLYYLLSMLDLKQYNEGTTIPSLRTDTLNRIEFNVPDLKAQDDTLSVLEPIEEKIELNNAINKNLEQQAQAIFKEKFPHILTGMCNDTISSIVTFSNGKKRPVSDGNVPVFGGNGVLSYTGEANANNCVIVGRVGAYCGNTYLCLGNCWISDNAIQAKSRTGESQLFVYYLLKNADLPSRHIGSGQPLMTQSILNAIPIVHPSEEGVKQFIEYCTPIHNAIDNNNIENQKLAELRDALLPKLMSGELDVSDMDI